MARPQLELVSNKPVQEPEHSEKISDRVQRYLTDYLTKPRPQEQPPTNKAVEKKKPSTKK